MANQLSSSQLRAARGLLDWSRARLAELSGISEPTIHRMETDSVQPHEKSITRIIQTFDENGAEFTDDGGVRPKQQSIEILTGLKGFHQFFDSVYDHARKYGGTIVQLGVDENLFLNLPGNADYAKSYNERMTALAKERKDITVLAILCEGDTNFAFGGYSHYRWISKDIFAPVPFYIYGEVLAIMDFQTIPGPTMIVHKLPAITHAYRKQFDAFWKMAREPQKFEKAKLLKAK